MLAGVVARPPGRPPRSSGARPSWWTRRSATSPCRRCLAGRRARPSATLPAGLVAELEVRLQGARFRRQARRGARGATRSAAGRGWPPLASPIGQADRSQALLHVLPHSRRFVVDELRDLVEGRTARLAEVDATVDAQSPWATASSGLRSRRSSTSSARTRGARRERGGASASALYGDDGAAAPLGSLTWPASRRRRARPARPSGCERSSGSFSESGTGEVTIEEGEMRVTIRRTEEGGEGPVLPLPVPDCTCPRGPGRPDGAAAERRHPDRVADGGDVLPGAAARRRPVRRGGRHGRSGADALHPRGDEADERGEGGVRGASRAVFAAENAAPVQYGDLLFFELEPLNGRPLDACLWMAIPRPVARTPYLLVPLPPPAF